jgi:cytochrome c oxidase assembly factor CtaG
MSEGTWLTLHAWNWAPSVLIGVALLAAGYLAATGPLRWRFPGSEPVTRRQTTWFMLGLFVILFALVSPLDFIGDNYLFSSHTIQHILLTLVGPPLLLLGTPGWLLRPVLSWPGMLRLARVLTMPLVAFALFNANFMLWHLPAPYEATLQNEWLHTFEHLLFMATGVILWWPIFSPLEELPRLSYPAQMLYLFMNTFPMTILSAFLTFAPSPLIATYADAPRLFGLTVMGDQELAGLIMWMPGGMIFLVALSAVFFKWAGTEEQPYDSKIV